MSTSVVNELKKFQKQNMIEAQNESYIEALVIYKTLVEQGLIRPRGYCLSSIADYSLGEDSALFDETNQ